MMLFASAFFVSCEDDETAGKTFVEDYPIFTDANGNLIQGSQILVQVGDQSYDYTFKCTLGDEDITSTTSYVITDVKGDTIESIDFNVPGVYTFSFSHATKNELSSWTAKRTVIVYNPKAPDISGSYLIDCARSTTDYFGDWMSFNSIIEKKSSVTPKTVVVTKGPAAGIFYIDDVYMGLFNSVINYSAKYPSYNFLFKAMVSVDEDYNVKLISGYSTAFGFGIADAGNEFAMTYDKDKKEIFIEANTSAYGAGCDYKGYAVLDAPKADDEKENADEIVITEQNYQVETHESLVVISTDLDYDNMYILYNNVQYPFEKKADTAEGDKFVYTTTFDVVENCTVKFVVIKDGRIYTKDIEITL